MYIKNNLAYAEDNAKPITVISVRSLSNYKLWVRFSTGETKIFDFLSLLDKGAFQLLKDESIFNSVYLDYGIPVWNDGTIDIAPEYLYRHGIDTLS
jgi:hypothetical protein